MRWWMYFPKAVGTPLGIRVILLVEGRREPTLGGAASVSTSCFLCFEMRWCFIGLWNMCLVHLLGLWWPFPVICKIYCWCSLFQVHLFYLDVSFTRCCFQIITFTYLCISQKLKCVIFAISLFHLSCSSLFIMKQTDSDCFTYSNERHDSTRLSVDAETLTLYNGVYFMSNYTKDIGHYRRKKP